MDDDPTLEDEMRDTLRRMAALFVADPDELRHMYDEIDAMIAKLNEPEDGSDDHQ